MKKTTLSIILAIVAVAAAIMVGCSSQPASPTSVAQDNATPPALEPIKGVDVTTIDPETGEVINLSEKVNDGFARVEDPDSAGPCDPDLDPAQQGNAPIGGGQNDDSGPGPQSSRN